MVFSRYSVVLFRRLTNNFNKQTKFITNKNDKNYSTLITSERIDEGPKKPIEFVSIIDKKLPPDSTNLKTADFNFEESDVLFDVEEKRPGVFDPCVDDLSHITPDFPVSFNFAAYADKSPIIQRLAELGVDFSKLEKRHGIAEYLLRLDFDKDIKYHIRFLNDCGVPTDQLGEYLTKNPLILKENLDDLHTRIRYLGAHKFSRDMIARIVSNNPYWVMFSTKRIDTRLGFFQKEFHLSGNQIRELATKLPRLITYRMEHIKENTFAVRELMGFDKFETKSILMNKPRIWMKNREFIVNTFDYAHNEMKLSHAIICQQPGILTCRLHRLKERHMFLVTQNKAQYDPQKPMYVSPLSLISNTDAEFCSNVAKTPVETYNMFLKSL